MEKINEFGEIIRDESVPAREQTPEEKAYEEYTKLVYDLSHPERFSVEEYEQKKARRTELEQSGLLTNDDKSVQFKIAQLKMQIKSQQNDNSVLSAGIARFKKQND